MISEKQKLVLPRKCSMLDETEQMYLEGGITLTTSRMFLNKTTCDSVAFTYIKNCGWKNITQDQLKKEIYAHAYVYYKMAYLQNIPISTVQDIYNSAANGIDIEDKVDSRQWAFELIWNFD